MAALFTNQSSPSQRSPQLRPRIGIGHIQRQDLQLWLRGGDGLQFMRRGPVGGR